MRQNRAAQAQPWPLRIESTDMKSNVKTFSLILIVLGLISCGQRKSVAVVEKAQDQPEIKSVSKVVESAKASNPLQPKNRYVPDEQTAIAIAVAVWIPIYGRQQIENEKPYKAKLNNGVWTVTGSLPEGFDGGTAVAEISQEDGRVLKIIHYQ